MMRIAHSTASIIAGLVLAIWAGQIHAEYILSAPPRESLGQGRKMYEPFAHYLSELIGDKVVYAQPRDWAQYSMEMRSGRYDIVFDGPHFAAWRIKHLKHIPVARLPGALNFWVVARKDDRRIYATKDLAAFPVCALASPNLGTTALLSQFRNPVLQPELFEIKGGFDDVYQAFKAKQCRAAVIRDNVYSKLSEDEKKELKVIFRSRPMPNQTITISGRIKGSARERLTAALTKKEGVEAAESIFGEFSKNAHYFVAVRNAEYDEMEAYLEGKVWGW